MASGISAGIIRALKITADSMALFGEDSAMMLSLFASGIAAAKIAGMIAKYLATSLTMLNVVMAPRVIRSCFPIDTTAISFDGSLSRSTMFAASFAACVPLFIACLLYTSDAADEEDSVDLGGRRIIKKKKKKK